MFLLPLLPVGILQLEIKKFQPHVPANNKQLPVSIREKSKEMSTKSNLDQYECAAHCTVPQFDGCDQLILSLFRIGKHHLQPGVEYDAGDVARRLNGVGKQQQGGQGWHPENDSNQYLSFAVWESLNQNRLERKA